MDKASPSEGEDCRFESCRVYFDIPVACHEGEYGFRVPILVQVVPAPFSTVASPINSIARRSVGPRWLLFRVTALV